jgi:hypothetical protein
MAYLAVQEKLAVKAVEWMEHVSDDQYAGKSWTVSRQA